MNNLINVKEEQKEKEMVKEYYNTRRNITVVQYLLHFLMFLSILVAISFPFTAYISVSLLSVLAILHIVVKKNKLDRCPFCHEKLPYKTVKKSKFCPHCSKCIRLDL